MVTTHVLAGGFIFDYPKEKSLLLGLDIFCHLIAVYFGSRGWRGYTKQERRHQRFRGIIAVLSITVS